MGRGRGEPASAGLWTSHVGRCLPGWGEPPLAVGKGLRQWADGVVWSSLPSAAPWFYWSRLGYPADSQKTTFVTREQPSVQPVSLYEARVPPMGWHVALTLTLPSLNVFEKQQHFISLIFINHRIITVIKTFQPGYYERKCSNCRKL